MIKVLNSMAKYLEFLAAGQLHILIMDCAICSADELSLIENCLISPIAGAYISGGDIDLYSDIVGEMVSYKSMPTGEYSGFDLRWTRRTDGLIKHIWEAKHTSFLEGTYEIVALTSDSRFQDEEWIDEMLKIYLDSD